MNLFIKETQVLKISKQK